MSAVTNHWEAQPAALPPISEHELVRRGEAVAAQLHSLCRPAGGARFVAKGSNDIRTALARLANATKRSIRNTVVSDRFDGSGATTALNEQAHRRGVVVHRVINRVSAERYALLPLTNLYAQRVVVAPVRRTLILADERQLVFAGPPTEAGEGTMWVTEEPDAIEAVRNLTDAQLDGGLPIAVLPPTPTNQRRLTVLIQLLDGQTDRAIARRLGVSERCVEKDIAAIKELAGASTRMELVWSLGYSLDRHT